MERVNNPAARLHRILTQLRSQNSNTKAIDAWSAILRTPSHDGLRLLQRYARVIALPGAVRDEITQIHVDHELYLRWVPKVQTTFLSHSLTGLITHFHQHVDQADVDRIEFCAVELSRSRPEPVVEGRQLVELLHHAQELRRECLSDEIALDLRDHLLRYVDEIISAIEEYDIVGIQPLRRSMEAAVGSSVVDRERSKRLDATPVGKKFFQFVYNGLLILNMLHGALQLPHDVQTIFVGASAAVEMANEVYPRSGPTGPHDPTPVTDTSQKSRK